MKMPWYQHACMLLCYATSLTVPPDAPCLQLYQPMPIMIWIAAIVEAVIENWADFGILMGIQFINAFLGW